MDNKKRTQLLAQLQGFASQPAPPIETQSRRPLDPDQLVTTDDVAMMLCCSPKTVGRLEDAGDMPASVRINSLKRWPRSVIVAWIQAGCPKRQNAKGGSR